MSLIQSIENQGNFLFKYRGQFPVILFLLSIPFIYLTDYRSIDNTLTSILILISILLEISVSCIFIGLDKAAL